MTWNDPDEIVITKTAHFHHCYMVDLVEVLYLEGVLDLSRSDEFGLEFRMFVLLLAIFIINLVDVCLSTRIFICAPKINLQLNHHG